MHQPKFKGFFIALEGIDGAGKSTVKELIRDWFIEHGVEPIMTREPGGTPLAEDIRRVVLATHAEPMPTETAAHLMMASRAAHLSNLIIPSLEKGRLVITDRFCDSTFCHQGAGGMDVDTLIQMHELSFGKMYPDLTIVLDGDPEVFWKRMESERNADELNHFDTAGLEFHNFSRKMHRTLAERQPERYAVVNAEVNLEQVFAQIIPHLMVVNNHLRKRPTVRAV